jgi:hypothetical protein
MTDFDVYADTSPDKKGVVFGTGYLVEGMKELLTKAIGEATSTEDIREMLNDECMQFCILGFFYGKGLDSDEFNQMFAPFVEGDMEDLVRLIAKEK